MDNRYIRYAVVGSETINTTNLWTLSKCVLSSPTFDTQYVDVPGRSAPLDLTDVFTLSSYKRRELTATVECSGGDRVYRTMLIKSLFTKMHGKLLQLQLPDYNESQYLVGRPNLEVVCNDLAHAIVNIDALCDPFIYSSPTVDTYTATNDEMCVTVSGAGDMIVVPKIVVSDEVNIKFHDYDVDARPVKTYSYHLTKGTHMLPELIINSYNGRTIYISGSGTVQISHKVGTLF